MGSKKEMLFNNETVYRTDFIKYDVINTPKTKYVLKAKKPEINYSFAPDHLHTYVETMSQWRNYVPFDLYIRPNPVRCDPRIKQEHYENLADLEREQVQKTRPRLVMTPAISLDDIDDPQKRSLVVDDLTYVTTLAAAQRAVAEVAFPVEKNVRAPLCDTYAPPKPIDLPKKRQYISPEWRMESIFWDRRLQRGFADPLKEFWVRRSSKKDEGKK